MSYDFYSLNGREKSLSLGESSMSFILQALDFEGVLSKEVDPEKWPEEPECLYGSIQIEDAFGNKCWDELRELLPILDYDKVRHYYKLRQEHVSICVLPLIPSFKFRSNDGWIVMPEECGIICDALLNFYGKMNHSNSFTKVFIGDWQWNVIDEFADFNKVCIPVGGYEVL